MIGIEMDLSHCFTERSRRKFAFDPFNELGEKWSLGARGMETGHAIRHSLWIYVSSRMEIILWSVFFCI